MANVSWWMSTVQSIPAFGASQAMAATKKKYGQIYLVTLPVTSYVRYMEWTLPVFQKRCTAFFPCALF